MQLLQSVGSDWRIMARVNIEESWWTDPRRFKLGEELGSLAMADGLVVQAWHLSQQFWGNGRKKIPMIIFQQIQNNQLLFRHKLALRQGGFVYVRGTSQFHEWYAQYKESGAKGGKSKANRLKRTPSELPSERLPSPSPSPSPSYSYSNTTTRSARVKNEISSGKERDRAEREASAETPMRNGPEIEKCSQEWIGTLSSMGVSRTEILPHENMQIAEAIRRLGFETARDALYGIRFEKGREDYNPRDHIRIARAFDPRLFDKWVNLASIGRKEEVRKAAEQKRNKELEELDRQLIGTKP